MLPELNEKLLHVEDLSKVFTIRRGFSSVKFLAVDQASFAIEAATPEIFAVAGESGSGKTTLARMMLGMIEPTSGQMIYKNRNVTHLKGKEKRDWFFKEVQPIFQDPFATFSPLKRIDTYLYETALNYKLVKKANVDAYIDDVLGLVGLSLAEVKGRYPNELSGGQAQRVSIARALLTQPSLLIADEPVSMLDASLRMSIVNLFKQLKEEQGVSVLYITHDLTTAYYAADRIAVMLRGWSNPLHPYTQLLKQAIPEADPNKKWEGKTSLTVSETEEFIRTGCKYAGRCPAVMEICKQEIPKDYFVDGRTVKCFLYEGEALAKNGSESAVARLSQAPAAVPSKSVE
jgi:peptide/nickel transport system ATP-binding protein